MEMVLAQADTDMDLALVLPAARATGRMIYQLRHVGAAGIPPEGVTLTNLDRPHNETTSFPPITSASTPSHSFEYQPVEQSIRAWHDFEELVKPLAIPVHVLGALRSEPTSAHGLQAVLRGVEDRAARVVVRKAVYEAGAFRNESPASAAALIVTIDAEPVEDGLTHPGEHVLTRMVQRDSVAAKACLERILRKGCSPAMAAAVLRLLGRIDRPFDVVWRAEMVAEALRHRNVEVRDAAVQAVEQWEELDLIPTLQRHNESIDWLQDYIHQVIADLSAP